MAEGYTFQSVNSWIKSGIIPFRFLPSLSVPLESHAGLRVGVGRRQGGRMAWLPAVLPVDEQLGFFLGMFVADGSATKTYVRIDIGLSEPDLLETTCKTVESLFGISPRVYKERWARMHVVQINSAGLVRVLERVFGLPGSSEKGKLKVPDLIFNSGESAARGFVEGLIAGDGYIRKRRRFINIATKSRELQNQLGFLAARLGLTFRIARQRTASHPLYTVNFVGPETLGKITDWEFLKDEHRAVARSWTTEGRSGTCTHARYERLPIKASDFLALTKATRTSSNPRVGPTSRACPSVVRQKVDRMRRRRLREEQTEQMLRIERLVGSDVGFVFVRSVKELVSRPEYVYCLQLDDSEMAGFVTGE
ncbi:MAG: hypothetical protein E6K96_10335, partial [Thaumarchaeota archaeon]